MFNASNGVWVTLFSFLQLTAKEWTSLILFLFFVMFLHFEILTAFATWIYVTHHHQNHLHRHYYRHRHSLYHSYWTKNCLAEGFDGLPLQFSHQTKKDVLRNWWFVYFFFMTEKKQKQIKEITVREEGGRRGGGGEGGSWNHS